MCGLLVDSFPKVLSRYMCYEQTVGFLNFNIVTLCLCTSFSFCLCILPTQTCSNIAHHSHSSTACWSSVPEPVWSARRQVWDLWRPLSGSAWQRGWRQVLQRDHHQGVQAGGHDKNRRRDNRQPSWLVRVQGLPCWWQQQVSNRHDDYQRLFVCCL